MGKRPDASLPRIVKVRSIQDEDLGAVLRIAAETPTAPHWPEFEFRRMLRVCRAEPNRRAAWAAVDSAGGVRGFAMASCVAEVAELETVVTEAAFQRQGIGHALARAAELWARAAGAQRLLLEARASNAPALRLYRRLGFTEQGVRRGYYRNPDEDAVLLSLPFQPVPF